MSEPMMTVCSRTAECWPFETDSRCDGCRTFPLREYLGIGTGVLEVRVVKHWRDSDPLLVLHWRAGS